MGDDPRGDYATGYYSTGDYLKGDDPTGLIPQAILPWELSHSTVYSGQVPSEMFRTPMSCIGP